VSPWTKDLVLTDAFRAPLAEVFKLLEVIRNYQLENRWAHCPLIHVNHHIICIETQAVSVFWLAVPGQYVMKIISLLGLMLSYVAAAVILLVSLTFHINKVMVMTIPC